MNEAGTVASFSKKFIVEESLVGKYLSHLEELEMTKKKREDSRKRVRNDEKNKV